MGLLNDRSFLRALTGFERALAKVLALALVVVLIVATLQFLLLLGNDLFDLQVNWTGEGLIRLLDEILVILIAVEVLQNLTAYLREHAVQIELVLVTALTAVARKVIVMPPWCAEESGGTDRPGGGRAGHGCRLLARAPDPRQPAADQAWPVQNRASQRVPGSGSVATSRWRR